jgi:hypothetical protein
MSNINVRCAPRKLLEKSLTVYGFSDDSTEIVGACHEKGAIRKKPSSSTN